MRLSSLPWLLCAASSIVTAASSAAKVFVYDSEAPSQASTSPETVDPATARLILAQRLGLGQYHTISNVNEESIRQINAFSPQQQALFRHERHTEPISRLLIVVEGLEESSDSLWKNFRSFSISPVPHPSDSYELFSAFASEAADLPTTEGQDYQLLKLLTPISETPGNTLKPIANRRYLQHIKMKWDMDNIKLLEKTIADTYSLAQERKLSISIMLTPSASKSSKPSTHPFGLTKRTANAARAPQEQPLISKQKSVSKPASASVPAASSTATATKVLLGAIPTCFASLSACERNTNNCTSHGSCILKWSTETTNEGGSISKQDCFGCACTKPDVRTNKDGTKKTTNYGGGACHKVDIVFPFWLLAGSTVFLMGIVGWALGLLYEMGGQELPSVIGAGVSGPKAR